MEIVNEAFKIPVFISNSMLQFYSSYMEILAVVGVGFIIWNLYGFLHFWYSMIQQYAIPYFLSRTKHIRQYGEWAVVTGATDGIGKAYAEELASHGMNILLISRTPEKLKKVSEAIAETYKVKTQFIVADFSLGREVYPHIKEALRDVDVGILVNNVGVFYEHLQLTTELPENKIWEMINVNIAAAVLMVHIVLPEMVQRRRGAIINVSSVSCCRPTPLINMYAATKSFMDHFTQGLHYEYASKGIFIQSLVTYFVKTNMISFSTFLNTMSFLVIDAKDYARQAVRTIGISRRTAGHFSHSIQVLLSCWIPEWIWVYTIKALINILRKEKNLKPVTF